MPISDYRLHESARQADPEPESTEGGIPVTPDERRTQIIALVEAGESVTPADLAARFGVSEDSIRRDLRALADLGMDSLTAIELRLAIETRLRLDVPLLNLADGVTIATLAARIDQALRRPELPEAAFDLSSRYEAPPDPFSLGGLDAAAQE